MKVLRKLIVVLSACAVLFTVLHSVLSQLYMQAGQ